MAVVRTVTHGGVSLVESSMNDRPASGSASVLLVSLWGVGVEPGRWWVRGSLGTLLSPEASAVWLVSLAGRRESSGGPPLRVPAVGASRWGRGSVSGLVGVVLVNWIVDASILRQPFTRGCRDLATTAPLRLLLVRPMLWVGLVGLGLSMSSLCSFAL